MILLKSSLVNSRFKIVKNLNSLLPKASIHTEPLKIKNAKVAIVGSGPAALYTAQYVLKNFNADKQGLTVDIYEKMPVPFGLVRYGVAPDHQDVKNVINLFTDTLLKPNVNFYGNVSIGTDLKIAELMSAYTAVVLAYGSHSENYLNIKGEKTFKNLISAREFVSWYNGVPHHQAPVDLANKRRVVIVGAGNVALDIARILVSPAEKLASTDISSQALDVFRKCSNSIERVSIVARRGILNAAFTLKELRELTKIDPHVACRIDPNHFDDICLDLIANKLSRPRRRITEFMASLAQKQPSSSVKKVIEFVFLKTPIEIVGDTENGPLNGVKFVTNRYDVDFSSPQLKLDTEDGLNALPVVEDKNKPAEIIPADLVVRSIGYKNVKIDDDIPFDTRTSIVPNEQGRVLGAKGMLYCTGWIKRGPRGVIVETTSDAYETAQRLCSDLSSLQPAASSSSSGDHDLKTGSQAILGLLQTRNIKVVDKQGWLRIDHEEKRRGRESGKPREKLNSINDMLAVAFSSSPVQ